MNIMEQGEVFRLARSATNKALSFESTKHVGKSFDKLRYDAILYTDDPTTAMYFLTPDMADICGVSNITNVCIVMGENFPDDSFEANRSDKELPRIATLLLLSEGHKCPRCRKFTAVHELCERCEEVLNEN